MCFGSALIFSGIEDSKQIVERKNIRPRLGSKNGFWNHILQTCNHSVIEENYIKQVIH
jgi:hypothetical protein